MSKAPHSQFLDCSEEIKVALLYQAVQLPAINGILKPMKPGGYSDSSADIAFALKKGNFHIIIPIKDPNPSFDTDWCFPDTREIIKALIAQGVNTFWLNTVLHSKHPITEFTLNDELFFVGQNPQDVERYDDKSATNCLLREHGIPTPNFIKLNHNLVIEVTKQWLAQRKLYFPFVVKPIRGRGSQGVKVVKDFGSLKLESIALQKTGNSFIVEEFLSGIEITVTVMPPGAYQINKKLVCHDSYWALPPVKRFNHVEGVAPYNGVTAVIKNSLVIDSDSRPIQKVIKQCKKAALLIKARAPIRIDCRADQNGDFFLFDLNMKPNMTGKGRPGRDEMDSLSAMAAYKIGWDYQEFVVNILAQRWPVSPLNK
jgi:D-alanine-D-alanine ligase